MSNHILNFKSKQPLVSTVKIQERTSYRHSDGEMLQKHLSQLYYQAEMERLLRQRKVFELENIYRYAQSQHFPEDDNDLLKDQSMVQTFYDSDRNIESVWKDYTVSETETSEVLDLTKKHQKIFSYRMSVIKNP